MVSSILTRSEQVCYIAKKQDNNRNISTSKQELIRKEERTIENYEP